MNRYGKIFILISGISLMIIAATLISGCYLQNQMAVGTDSRYFPENQSGQKLSENELEKFMSSVKKVNGQAQSHYEMALHFQKNRRHKLAIAELKKAVQSDPSMAKAYNAMGISYDRLHQNARAINCYRLALNLNADLDYVYNNLGYSYLLSNNPEAAIKTLQKAVQLNGQNKRYRYNLALAYVMTDSYDLAIEQLRGIEGKSHSAETVAKWARKLGKKDYEKKILTALHKDTSPSLKGSVRDKNQVPLLTGAQTTQESEDRFSGKKPLVIKNKIAHPAPFPAITKNELHTDLQQEVDGEEDRKEMQKTADEATLNGFTQHQIKVVWQDTDVSTLEQKKGTPGAVADPEKIAGDRGSGDSASEVKQAVTKTNRLATTAADREKGRSDQTVLISAAKIIPQPLGNESQPPASVPQDSDVADPTGLIKNNDDHQSPFAIRSDIDVRIEIEVANGNGINGFAGKVARILKQRGFNVTKITNAQSFDHLKTKVFYCRGQRQSVADLLNVFARQPDKNNIIEWSHYTDRIKIIVGKDLIGQNRQTLKSES